MTAVEEQIKKMLTESVSHKRMVRAGERLIVVGGEGRRKGEKRQKGKEKRKKGREWGKGRGEGRRAKWVGVYH